MPARPRSRCVMLVFSFVDPDRAQRAPALARAAVRMTAARRFASRSSRESLLIALALAYIGLMLVLPLGRGAGRGVQGRVERLARRDRRARRAGGDQADPAGRRDLGPAQHDLRPRRGLGDRQVRLSRQDAAGGLHRAALLDLAGRLGAGLRAAVRRPGLVRRVAGRSATSASSSRFRAWCSRPSSSPCRSSPAS